MAKTEKHMKMTDTVDDVKRCVKALMWVELRDMEVWYNTAEGWNPAPRTKSVSGCRPWWASLEARFWVGDSQRVREGTVRIS